VAGDRLDSQVQSRAVPRLVERAQEGFPGNLETGQSLALCPGWETVAANLMRLFNTKTQRREGTAVSRTRMRAWCSSLSRRWCDARILEITARRKPLKETHFLKRHRGHQLSGFPSVLPSGEFFESWRGSQHRDGQRSPRGEDQATDCPIFASRETSDTGSSYPRGDCIVRGCVFLTQARRVSEGNCVSTPHSTIKAEFAA
jgi:hypothetical protein